MPINPNAFWKMKKQIGIYIHKWNIQKFRPKNNNTVAYKTTQHNLCFLVLPHFLMNIVIINNEFSEWFKFVKIWFKWEYATIFYSKNFPEDWEQFLCENKCINNAEIFMLNVFGFFLFCKLNECYELEFIFAVN